MFCAVHQQYARDAVVLSLGRDCILRLEDVTTCWQGVETGVFYTTIIIVIIIIIIIVVHFYYLGIWFAAFSRLLSETELRICILWEEMDHSFSMFGASGIEFTAI